MAKFKQVGYSKESMSEENWRLWVVTQASAIARVWNTTFYRGKSMTGQGMNSASRFASTCLEWMASMLITTKSRFRSSATSPMMAVDLFPSPSRSRNLNSSNPPINFMMGVKNNQLVRKYKWIINWII